MSGVACQVCLLRLSPKRLRILLGPITIYKDTKAKCRHLKKITCKGTVLFQSQSKYSRKLQTEQVVLVVENPSEHDMKTENLE